MSRFALILPAAGRSVRYGAGTSKLLENLAGIPVIARAIHPFLQRSDLAKIIIPCNEPDELAARAASLGIPCSVLGRAGGDRFTLGELVDLPLDSVRQADEGNLARMLGDS